MTRKSGLLAFAMIVLSACSGGQAGYMEATIDGKATRFSARAEAVIAGDGKKLETIHLLAQRKDDHPYPRMIIDVQMYGADIKPGQYSYRTTRTEHPRPGQGQTDSLYAEYYSSDVPASGDLPVIMYASSAYPNESPGNDFALSITNINKMRAEGTFSGRLVNLESGKIISVTSGSFSLPVKYVAKVPGS